MLFKHDRLQSKTWAKQNLRFRVDDLSCVFGCNAEGSGLEEEPVSTLETNVQVKSRDEDSAVQQTLRSAYRRILLELSSLPRSMGVMFIISVLSGLGTIIEQNKVFQKIVVGDVFVSEQGFQFYVDNYPTEGPKMLGFLTYRMILFLQLDHIYTAPYFYGLMGLLVAQLIACTHTRQYPMAKAARRWRFAKTPSAIAGKENAQILPDANIQDLGTILSDKGYEIFLKNGSLYGFRSLVSRLAPIGVHIALLATIAGICWGLLGGYKGAAMIPVGRETVMRNYMRPNSIFALPPYGSQNTIRVDDFNIDYRSDGSISQFYSDLTILHPKGDVSQSKTISVNDPLRSEGVTIYQTDWGMSALSVTVESKDFPEGKRSVRFPMATLIQQERGGGKAFATFIPIPNKPRDENKPEGVAVVARDFQTVAFYERDGSFAGIRRPGSGNSIDVAGMKITVDGINGSTGLEFKYDPGVPLVYAGFAGVMITTLLSFLSHAQIWALQVGRDVHIAGKSSKGGILFKREIDSIIDLVPDSGSN